MTSHSNVAFQSRKKKSSCPNATRSASNCANKMTHTESSIKQRRHTFCTTYRTTTVRHTRERYSQWRAIYHQERYSSTSRVNCCHTDLRSIYKCSWSFTASALAAQTRKNTQTYQEASNCIYVHAAYYNASNPNKHFVQPLVIFKLKCLDWTN